MAIFENELVSNTNGKDLRDTLDIPLKSANNSFETGLSSSNIPKDSDYLGITPEQASRFKLAPTPMSPNSSFSSVSQSELMANQKYPLYERGVDLENIYGMQQGALSQLGNGVMKLGATAIGTFAQSFATIPNTINALKSEDISELSGSPDGYEASVDDWLKNIENYFPNYYTRAEKEHPFRAMIPFTTGSANFWGDKIIKNIGFTIGAIGGALAQDAIITGITGGMGTVPLLASQVGKASLWLNKIFAAGSKIDDVLSFSKGLNVAEKSILTLNKLENLSKITKLTNGFRYTMNLYGSARTEAAIEGRDNYKQIKSELTELYKEQNGGTEPDFEELKIIDEYATDAMNTRFGINMALLTVSNAVQFDNLFRSFSTASKKGVGNLASENLKGAGKIGLKDGSLDVFEKIIPSTLTGKVWSAVKPKLGIVFSEGVYEEGGQFATEKGTYDYFTRKYKNSNNKENVKDWKDINEIIKSTTVGLSEQFGSTEGLENMLIGAISALITGGALNIRDNIKGQGSNARLSTSINILNNYGLTGVLGNKYENTTESVIIAKQMRNAAQNNNVYEYKNLKNELFYKFVSSRIPSGMHDVTIEQLNLLKDLSKEEFEKTFGMDFSASNKNTVQEYVDSLINKANEIKKTSETLNNTFKNPYKQIMNPASKEEVEESYNYSIFENWKTELGQLYSVKDDSKQRLSSIQQSLLNINPLLTNHTVSYLTNKESLKELSDIYEEKANQLSLSLNLEVSIEQKRNSKNQIKALRTAGEKINLFLKSEDPQSPLIKEIFNFELNNQDSNKEEVISAKDIDNVYNTGLDINKLLSKNKKASKILDDLISESGFDKYFDSAKDVSAEVYKEEGKEDTLDVEAEVFSNITFKNKLGKNQIVKQDREYELSKIKRAVITKSGDRFKITAPDGSITFQSTKEKAQEEVNDINLDISDLAKVKVIDINSDGTIKIEDLAGNIQNIKSEQLSGYSMIETDQDKLEKNKESLDKQQNKIEDSSGKGPTIPAVAGEIIGSEDRRKDVDIVFLAGTSPSEDTGGAVKNNLPFIKRGRTFLNNFKFFKNKDKYKLILVTPNNAEKLGLKGIVQLSYEVVLDSPLTEEQTNIEKGFMAQVYIIQNADGDFFVNKKGEIISKVGEENPTLLDDVIFQTMTSASTTTEGGFDKIRKGQEADAEIALEAYKLFRKAVFEQEGYTPYSFAISRGIPRENIVNDIKEDNHLENILGPDGKKIITTQEGLLIVVTTGKVENNGESLTFPMGTTLIKFGDLLDFANNKKVNNKQASNIFAVIDALANDLIDKLNKGQVVKINAAYSTFLQNVLYWKFKSDTTSASQIGIDTTTMEFKIGKQSFPLSKISENKQAIMDALQEAFITVNNKTLSEKITKNFKEYVVDKDGNLTTVTWPNYQTYLLSSTNPDGSSRSIEDTPLITHTASPSEAGESYKQKYAYITGKNVLPYDKVPAKTVTPVTPIVVKEGMIGEYNMDGKQVNTFNDLPIGPVSFTGTILNNEIVTVEITDNKTIEETSTNQETVTNITNKLKSFPESLVTIDLTKALNEDIVKLYAKIALENVLGIQLEKQQESKSEEIKEEETPEETPEVKPYNPSGIKKRRPLTRLVGEGKVERMTNSDLEVFKEWHAKNVPFIPFEILEKIIERGDIKAWGVFENGVAKFVRGSLRGTEYHEIFEAIWAGFLTETEKNNIIKEFRAKSGEFTDRASGKKYLYSDPYVSEDMIKERIADDFSDFRVGKLPGRSIGEKIRNFFKRIMDFFKSFVSKPSLKNELFKAIDSGKFKETKLSAMSKTLAPQYRAEEGLSEQVTNEYIQDMVGYISFILFEDGKKELLFNPEEITGEALLLALKTDYQDRGVIDALGEDRYNNLVKRTIQFLRTIGISVNAEEIVSINDEETNNRDYAPEPFSTDWKKHSTGALKFLLSTLQERESLNQMSLKKNEELKKTETTTSSIGGIKLLNYNRVFATLLDRLHNTNDPAEFVKKFIQLAKEDSNYVPLFKALGGNLVNKTFDYDNFGESDWRLFIQFFNTFTRQKPEALIQYISEEGDTYTSNANIFTIINQTVDSWISNMKTIGKAEGGNIYYDAPNKLYKINRQALQMMSIKKSKDKLNFLASLGIDFSIGTYEALSDRETIIKGKVTSEMKMFIDSVESIYAYLGKNNNLMTFDTKRLGINGPLRTLATLNTKVNNPNQDSTYFGVEGQRIGSFAENNAPSYFQNTFNESNTLEELLDKMPQLEDVYSKGSEILRKGGLFFDEDGKRIAEITVEYIQGNKNQKTGKNKSTSKLGLGERHVQEINQNINGKYYILIPGDSSTEWMMNMGNVISMEEIIAGEHWNKVYNIYNNYLNDDINLALEDRKSNLNTKNKSQELRIMKDILPQDIVEEIENMIQENKTFNEISEYVSKNKEKINAAIKDFIESVSKETFSTLLESNQITSVGEDQYLLGNFDTEFLKEHNLYGSISFEEALNFINFANINYEINNHEFHKILFGDPYQFKTEKGKLDETKRIKSFLSPRRRTFNLEEYNNYLKEKYNSVEGIELDDKTPGHHNYKSYTNTITLNDVNIVGSIATLDYVPDEIKDAYTVDDQGKPKVNEADAMSWLMDNTHKEIALKEGQWSKESEAFHQWHMSYTRQRFDKKGIKTYTNESLRKYDAKMISKSIPKHKLAIRKPIVTGNKNNKTEIDLILDKTSQMPIYYHMVEDTALGAMYEQMFDQNIGYAIVISGRKVGAETLHDIYNSNGESNVSKFESIVEVPWSIYGTQVETMSEGEKHQTRGSQLTKGASVDLYENGEPIGATPERKEIIKKAYERNTKALNNLNDNAYNDLLKRLGIEDIGDDYILKDKKSVSDTLMYEMLRRELSENAKDTIELDKNLEFLIPLEASPSYTQIKNILYSLVSKALTSPAMNGAPHVQVPVTMFEKATKGRSLAMKTDKGWVKISKNHYKTLTEEEKKKVVLTDDTLKFYTKEDPYCEIMLPAWFRNQLNKYDKFKTDEDLINYLNNTPDGKRILKGIGFRIPTQSLSSVEVFKVKGFLPEYMGYTVVVPSEITTKAGSDFDIDKLNMYLKSIYIDKTGDIRLVQYKGSEDATKKFYGDLFDKGELLTKKQLEQLDEILLNARASTIITPSVTTILTDNLIFSMFGDVGILLNTEDEYTNDFIQSLTEQGVKETLVNDLYKKSLENEYYESLEELITLDENFDKLISPVNDAGLENISELLDEKRGYNETTIKGRLINRNYMTNMRHAFITGKRWVGIAAVNITNLSLRQKSKVYLNPAKINLLSANERKFMPNLDIVLPHNTVNVDGTNYVSLSGRMTADLTQFISNRLSGYATAFVDIANKPFITKIIKSDTIVSTFMFLEAIGSGNTGVYFLNQPIIEKYMEYLDSIGSKNVLGKKNLEYIRDLFPTTNALIESTNISVIGLLDNISEYSTNKKLSALKNAEQQLILNEFLKYKILADQLFSYTQAMNYDTTKFGSSDLYYKKQLGTLNAKNFNLISNVEEVLDNTFIGKQAELIGKVFDSYGTILKTELPEIKAYTISTLRRYATRKYMSADDYVKVANLIKNSFLDYIIQNNTSLKTMIKPMLVDSETAIVNKLEKAKQKYPSIQILQDLVPVSGKREDGAQSIQLRINSKDVYSENLYVGMMRELRDTNPELRELYNDIVNVAILQGVSQSSISIRNIIPVEDYAAKIAPIIQQLASGKSLEGFEHAMFERNNFLNKDIFTEFTPFVHTPKPNPNTGEYNERNIAIDPNTGEDVLVYWLPAFKSMKGAPASSRKLVVLNDVYNSFQLDADFIKIPKIVTNKSGLKINVATGLEITGTDYFNMKQKGAHDLYDTYYYQKVYTSTLDESGNKLPLKVYNKSIDGYDFYYKLINVYGDSNRAVEFNTELTPSVLDNGGIEIDRELTDQEIETVFAPKLLEVINELKPEENLLSLQEGNKNAPEGLPDINRTNKKCE